jgi:hypothetical protein
VITKLIAEALEISTADVNRMHQALLEEQSSADARYAATSALMHPEGSTTPINEACRRTQKRVADLREKARQQLPQAFALLLALQIATQRRDEAQQHREQKRDEDAEYLATGVKTDTRDWMGRLVNHGVYPSYLKNLSDENVAIIADMISWKAKDPRYKESANPWRDVLSVYATRRIEKPGKGEKAVRSVLGTPMRNRHIRELGDYMFNEMVEPSWLPITLSTIDAMGGSGAPAKSASSTGDAELGRVPHADAAKKEPIAGADAVPESRQGVANGDAEELSPSRAREIAEAIFDRNPIKMGIYWPRDWTDRDDYDPVRLVAALEAWVASGTAWTGAEDFLAEAKLGRGRQFIDARRLWGIERLADRLASAEPTAIEEARGAGLTHLSSSRSNPV